jgi:2-polyprenyl-6-hydroxyphenyl methylase/3-demethylubiquinone-9 3-methyltransferase
VGIGPHVRRHLGRFERPATEIYRRVFVDLDAFAAAIRRHAPPPARLLEIGCGEGALVERLARVYPSAGITAIDICPEPGRLCASKEARIRFSRMSAAELRATDAGGYPLVVIGDVLHHVPKPEREEVLSHAAALVAPGGMLVCKEWVRQRTLPYLMGYCADRLILGDDVHYMSEPELCSLARRVFGARSIRSQFRVPPWDCNLALVIVPHDR